MNIPAHALVHIICDHEYIRMDSNYQRDIFKSLL